MKTKLLLLLTFMTVLLGLLFSSYVVQKAYAFQVELLPEDNLIQNPWFRDSSNPMLPGHDSWINVDNYWTLSQKETNPSPDAFRGTAAKLAADDGNASVGVDSYLYQVVPANPIHRKLKFFTHWVAHFVDPFEVNIYGGESPDGPWTLVWVPLYQEVLTLLLPPTGFDQSWLWQEMTSWTPPVETILPNGYAYYKIEIHAILPDPAGFKFTGIYFASELYEEVTPTPTPTETPRRLPTSTATQTATETPPPDPRATQTPTSIATFTPTPTATETSAPVPTFTSTPTATLITTDPPRSTSTMQSEGHASPTPRSQSSPY